MYLSMLPDQARLLSADERTHLRVAGGVVPAPDVDEPALPFGGGEVELSPVGETMPAFSEP